VFEVSDPENANPGEIPMHAAAQEGYGTAYRLGLPKSQHGRFASTASWTDRFVGTEVGGRYRLFEPIASGGFGHVFLAEHVDGHALSAVKVTEPGSRLAACVLAHEADTLRRLTHPNVVRFQNYGELPEGSAYLAMDYAHGIELETWLEDHGPMPPERALGVLSQLAAALDYLHTRNVVHADVKPSHLILDEANGDALTLLDFGCAFDASDPVRSCDVGGTPGYMAPEQACGDRCTAGADVYAMAALASELLTGLLPHSHSTRSVQRAILTEPPALPSTRGLVRPGLDDAFARALSRNPRNRFSTAREFVNALACSFVRACA
jgi:eukaryotic-like serine/threonine-protein kinase